MQKNRQLLRTQIEMNAFLDSIMSDDTIKLIACDIETEELSDDVSKKKWSPLQLGLEGIGLYAGDKYQAYLVYDNKLDYSALDTIAHCYPMVFHNAKFDIQVLEKHKLLSYVDEIKLHDTMLMSFIHDEEKVMGEGGHGLKILAQKILKVSDKDLVKYGDVGPRPVFEDNLFSRADPEQSKKDQADAVQKWQEKMGDYCIDDCVNTYKLYYFFEKYLKKEAGLWKVYQDIEMQFIFVLLDMERRGIEIDTNYLSEMSKKVSEMIIQYGANVWKEAGKQFDINSPQQLKELLQKKYTLSDEHKTKKGEYSTDSSALEYLVNVHQSKLAESVLKYRELSKLQSTYIQSIPKLLFDDKAIHCNFKQTGTITARLSCVHADTKIWVNGEYCAVSKLIFTKYAQNYTISSRGNLQLINKIIYKGKEPMLKIKTNYGKEIICTTQHRLHTDKGWECAGNLSKGVKIYTADINIVKANKIIREQSSTIYKRRGFCASIYKEKIQKEISNKFIKDTTSLGRPFILSFSGQVQSRVKRGKTVQICSVQNGKYFWSKGAPQKYTRQSSIIKTHERREMFSKDCQRDANDRVPGRKQYTVSSIAKYNKFAKEYAVSASRYNRIVGKVSTRHNGKSYFVSGKASGIFRCYICSFFRSTCNSACYKKVVQSTQALQKHTKNEKRSYMLVNEQSRDVIGQGVNKKQYSSCKTVCSCRKDDGRFFLSAKGFDSGTRWGMACGGHGYTKQRPKKEPNSFKKWLYNDEIFDTRGVQITKDNLCKYNKETIESIVLYDNGKLQDVWDIEVDVDHGYIAQGLVHHNSSQPNLQNIPRRDDELNIRKAFRPRAGHVFVIADYSQLELRIMAHFCQDETMKKVYQDNGDIHQATADILKCDRTTAKSINFGINYCLSAFGMSKGLGISVEEAESFINSYFTKFPRVASFIAKAKNTVRANGFVETIVKRRRRFKNFNKMPVPVGQNYTDMDTYEKRLINKEREKLNARMERQAVNSIIQSSASDLMKIAMRNMYKRFKKEFPDTGILVQIHDEVVVECLENNADDVLKIVKFEMENALKLNGVPLVVAPKIAKVWEK